MYYDSTMIILIPGILLALYAQSRVKASFEKYSRVLSRKGITGAQVARMILDSNGLHSVPVLPTSGHLTDHYNPKSREIRLSEPVYGSSSIASIGIAAHEVGHALQHQENYSPLAIRSAIAPIAQFGSYASFIILFIGLMFDMIGLAMIGVYVFIAVVAFQLVTLPVEFNASNRAINCLTSAGILTREEITPARKVLNAAALTYVAAVINAVLQLVRLFLIANRRRR